MDPNPSTSQSPPKGATLGQITQLTDALNAILGQLTNVTQRLDHLEENRSRGPSVQHQTESHRKNSNSDHSQKRERPHRRRQHVRPAHDDPEDPLLRLIRVEAPSFDGCHQPSEYLDWKASMDQYFDWYPMAEERKVRLAKMRLTKLAKGFKGCETSRSHRHMR